MSFPNVLIGNPFITIQETLDARFNRCCSTRYHLDEHSESAPEARPRQRRGEILKLTTRFLTAFRNDKVLVLYVSNKVNKSDL